MGDVCECVNGERFTLPSNENLTFNSLTFIGLTVMLMCDMWLDDRCVVCVFDVEPILCPHRKMLKNFKRSVNIDEFWHAGPFTLDSIDSIHYSMRWSGFWEGNCRTPNDPTHCVTHYVVVDAVGRLFIIKFKSILLPLLLRFISFFLSLFASWLFNPLF